jgi:mono/diheme cytochrome c family protein
MQNTEALLRQQKKTLYAVLALLLCVLAAIVSWAMRDRDQFATVEEKPFCGTMPASSSPEFQRGKELFVANCASCHNKNMKDNLTGPALGGAEDRWAAFPRKDLYEWIRHSQRQIKSGHPRATELWKQWQPVIMNDFSGLSDADIEAILTYTRR